MLSSPVSDQLGHAEHFESSELKRIVWWLTTDEYPLSPDFLLNTGRAATVLGYISALEAVTMACFDLALDQERIELVDRIEYARAYCELEKYNLHNTLISSY